MDILARIHEAAAGRSAPPPDARRRRRICERCEHATRSGARVRCALCRCGEPWAKRRRCPVFKWGAAREMPLPKISVVVSAANSGGRLRATVEDFRANLRGFDHEFVVVPDAVTDGSLEGLGEDVVLLPNRTEMAGCCQGRIEGAKAATGGVLMFFDCHCAVLEGDLAELAAEAVRRGAIVYPLLADIGYGEDGKPFRRGGGAMAPDDRHLGFYPRQYRSARRETLRGKLSKCLSAGMGATMTRETYDGMGGWPWLPKRYGAEQGALARKAFLAGVRGLVHGDVLVGHYFRHGEKRPYPPPSRADGERNLWASWLTLVAPEAFEGNARRRLAEAGRERWGPEMERDEGVRAAREAFAPFKRRGDEELFGAILGAESVRCAAALPRRPRISAVVVSRDEGRELRATVEHFLANGVDEAVVVDDGSRDGSAEGLEGIARVLRNDAPAGVGNARNQGAAAATGDVLLFLDAHQRLLAGSVGRLAATAMGAQGLACPAFTLCGPDYSPPEGGRRWIYGGAYRLDENGWLRVRHARAEPERSVSPLECPIGGGYAIPKRVFDAMGGWVATSAWGYNEQAMGLKLWMMGVPMVLDTETRVAHLHMSKANNTKGLNARRLNAWRVHRVCFGDEAFEAYWAPVLARPCGAALLARARTLVDSAAVRREAAEFQAKRVRSDTEWFGAHLPNALKESSDAEQA